jgi:acyl transferase domain-containing protein
VFSDGAGVVLLKPLSHAIRDKDNIHAVILGSAINNDGRSKVGFTAPSTLGQADVLRQAYNVSKVSLESISYIEAHGTGTQIGDPIEIEALKSVFKNTNSVVLGSVKSNLGHLDVAAGVASLIKVVLALKNKTIPQTLHFNELNTKIDLKNTCFSINRHAVDWRSEDCVLRAGVNSFGIGGTNAHVIVEQAPSLNGDEMELVKDNLLLFSAKAEISLENYLKQIKKYVEEKEFYLEDLAFTQNFGRAWFDVRAAIHFSSKKDLVNKVDQLIENKSYAHIVAKQKIIFAFAGVGSEYPAMGVDLFKNVKLFREIVEEIASDTVLKNNQVDVSDLLYGSQDNLRRFEENKEIALFTFEYALGKFLIALGIEPFFMIGHGVGEYVAAVMSGVLSPGDAFKILFARKEINRQFEVPALLSINAGLNELAPHLTDEIFVAACNASTSTVVAGVSSTLDQFKQVLAGVGIRSILIPNTQIFNAGLSRNELIAFGDLLHTIKINPPTIPYLSSISGRNITEESVVKQDYWLDLMTQTIRFDEGISELLKYEHTTFLEVGPSMVISAWINRNTYKLPSQYAVSVVKNRHERASDINKLNELLTELWKRGVAIKFDKVDHCMEGKKISMPTYQFDKKYNWVDREIIDLHSMAERNSSVPAKMENSFTTKHEIEQQLLNIWSEVIGGASIDTRKNLFEMGITSLDAINVHRKLKSQINIQVEVTAMFEHPTIESFSEHLLNLTEN